MTLARPPAALVALAVAALAVLCGAVLGAAADVSLKLILLPFALLVAAVLAAYPRFTALLAVVLVALIEADAQGFLYYGSSFYHSIPVVPVHANEVLVGIAFVGVILERARSRREFRLPEPLTLPLMLLAVALAAGAVVGHAAGATAQDLIGNLRTVLVLILMPFIVVNVIEDERDLWLTLKVLMALVAFKSVIGLAGYALGQGRAVNGTVLTYYSPLPNMLLLLFVLGVFAARMAKAQLPRLAWWLAPLAFAVLILSFRRNFWIALALGALLVGLVAFGARGRLLVVPAAVFVVIGLYIGLTALSASQSESPVVQRAQSLAPGKLQANAEDRYRIDEQRNVRAAIASSPVLGLGLGIPWAQRYPVAVYFPGGGLYTHVVILWYWLKMGILGVLAYLALMATAVRTGLLLWRDAPDRRVRAIGLGTAAALVGLVVAETTGSFTGVDPRMSLLVGVVVGWLAVARRVGSLTAPT